MSKKDLENKVGRLLNRIDFLIERIESLEKENRALREELSKRNTQKNSKNSHMPPSSDISKTNRPTSLREPSGKKAGGNQARKGIRYKWLRFRT